MKRFVYFLVTVALLVAACGSDDPTPVYVGGGNGDAGGADPGDPSTPGGPAVIGQWQLVDGTLDGEPFPLVDGWRVTFGLGDDGAFGGTAACNSYGGTYSLNGDRLTLDEWAITEMGCEPPVAESEQAFITVLGRTLDARVEGEELHLTGDGVDLRFAAIPPVPTADLVGAEWELHTLIQGEAATQFIGESTLVLSPDGTFAAATGCRELTGTYEVNGDQLVIRDMTAAGECPPDLVEQDSAVISVFENARVAIDGDQLTLWSAGDDGLQFRALPSG